MQHNGSWCSSLHRTTTLVGSISCVKFYKKILPKHAVLQATQVIKANVILLQMHTSQSSKERIRVTGTVRNKQQWHIVSLPWAVSRLAKTMSAELSVTDISRNNQKNAKLKPRSDWQVFWRKFLAPENLPVWTGFLAPFFWYKKLAPETGRNRTCSIPGKFLSWNSAADWTTDWRSDFAKRITTLVISWTDDKILLLINLYEKPELTH